ncbi:integrase [Thermoanaerobacterium phage THSA-485A]|uniref:integrase n=1 Tax=Thermoanaerobacterium phage THSA-485A TaxID=1126885 RepID=UPI000263F8ED|nr:integrase [Thermoanaerobacterium phage THSA-485A]AFK87738.1 Recombinase [Thermoanaerobacterium phage THSA-485A]
MNRVCIYLRKSRADEEIEKELGQGETLAKHRKALLKFAKEKNLNIVKIREEIVSGESLIHRPEMLELLKEVEQGMYDAVLCMDLQRLGRGNMQEQGLILEAFKKSNTKIITLQKTYDLNNDFDEEYSEFEAFMSRKELKMINRRLQGGRVRSIQEGNYLSPLPPYGYLIHEEKFSRTLVPNPEQADVVKMIFDMYVNKQMGSSAIANELNKMGYKTYTGRNWASSSVINILKNPVYIGKITWKKKDIKKSADPNKSKDTRQRPRSEWIVSDGKHEPIVGKELFAKAQEIIKNKYHIPYQIVNGPRNPLAGLIICKICGSKMVYRPYKDKEAHIICPNKCGNKSSKFIYVEKRLLQALEEWMQGYELDLQIEEDDSSFAEAQEKQKEALERELHELQKQKNNLHDLLERGIYDIDTFVERSTIVAQRIEETQKSIDVLVQKIEEEKNKRDKEKILPEIRHVLDLYWKTDDIAQKNMLLKSVLEKAEYLKEKKQREDNFELWIYPKLPEK